MGALLLLALAPAYGLADTGTNSKSADLTELPLEDLMQVEVSTVYGASRFEQKITEAPSSVTIVYADEIKRYGYRNLAEVLRSVQGFQVSNDRNYSFLGVRGLNLGDFNSRILLMVDGHRVNNNLTDAAYIGNEFIVDIDLVDRVEIIRGPGAVIYGNNAFFGVINVITRKGRQLNGAEVSGEYGSYNSYKGRATYGKSLTNGVEFLVSGTYYSSDGAPHLFFPAYNTHQYDNGVASYLDGEQLANTFASISYKGLTLEGAFSHREKDNPTAQYFTVFDKSGLSTVDQQYYVDLKYDHSFPGIVDVNAQVYYDRSDFTIGYPEPTTLYKEEQSGEWWGAELQLTKKFWDRHVLTVGGEYRDDFRQSDRLYDDHTGELFSSTNRNLVSYGVYAQADIAIRTNLHAVGGIRYDQYGDFDGEWNPRMAMIYNPFTSSTLKAIYGTAFRAPNFLELSDPRFQNISPEQITAYELVYEQQIGPHFRSSVSGFYNKMDDLIVLQNGSFTNLNANATGMELALEALWPKGIRGRTSYTLQFAEDRSGGSSSLPDSPEQMFKFNLSVPLYKDKIYAGLEYQYTTSRDTLYTTTTGQTVPGVQVDGYGVLNFTLFTQNLLKNLEFSASVYNILNTSYSDPATRFHLQDQIPQDGRTFRIKLTYRF